MIVMAPVFCRLPAAHAMPSLLLCVYWLLLAAQVSAQADDGTYHTVIIGAGAAGLAASFTLINNGVPSSQVKILEAKDRIGGRVEKNTDFTDFPVDMGANFLQYDDWIERVVGDDYTLAAVQGNTEVPWLGNAKIMYNASIWDVLNDYVAPKDPGVVELGCQVTLVDYRAENGGNGKVIVECANGRTFMTDHVIVTVSLAILADKDITFQPSSDVDAIYDRHPCSMMDGLKLFMEFTTLFFPGINCQPLGPCSASAGGENLYFDYTSASPALESGNYIMGGYIIGPEATPFVGLSDEGIIDVLLDVLDEEFGGLARDSFVQGAIKNWSQDPFVKGSYSSCGYYDDNGNPAGALNIDNKVWIAGEAFPIDGEEYGWVDAGAFSGDDAAKQILLISEGRNVPDSIFWSRVETVTPLPTQQPTDLPSSLPSSKPAVPPTKSPTKIPVAISTPQPTRLPMLRPTTPEPTSCLVTYLQCSRNSDCCSKRCLSGICRAYSGVGGRDGQR
jgi:hypothetical protein